MNKIDFEIKVQQKPFSKKGNKFQMGIIIKIDGKEINNCWEIVTDLITLNESIKNSGEFYILNCVCGIPDCAKISEGIYVSHEQDQITWTIHKPKKIGKFIFDRNDYIQKISSLIDDFSKELKKMTGKEIDIFT